MAAACPPTPAAIVSRVEADTPDAARMQHAEGTAIVKIELDPSGKVTKTSIQKSAGMTALDIAAERAARATGYKPATENCKPVGSMYLMLVSFKD